jgi:DNA polymerase-3 subunit chi
VGEVRFYHLTERPLESVLPVLLEKSLERGWRVVVRGMAPARIEALTNHLWTYRDDSFLPHGTASDGEPARQPVWLGCNAENPNNANTLFLIDGAEAVPDELARMETTAILFDGLDEAALTRARDQWRAVTGASLKAVYWAQTPDGGWVKRHEAG